VKDVVNRGIALGGCHVAFQSLVQAFPRPLVREITDRCNTARNSCLGAAIEVICRQFSPGCRPEGEAQVDVDIDTAGHDVQSLGVKFSPTSHQSTDLRDLAI
jgi:hypothetical protein